MSRLVILVTAVAAASILLCGQPRQLSLVLVDRDGRKTPVGFVPLHTFAPRISPDGKRVAYDIEDGTVWIAELSNLSAPRKATAGRDHYPMWSASGDQIVFIVDEKDQQALFIQRADGTGIAERLATARARILVRAESDDQLHHPQQLLQHLDLLAAG